MSAIPQYESTEEYFRYYVDRKRCYILIKRNNLQQPIFCYR